MKYFLYVIFILVMTLFILGFYFQNTNPVIAPKYLGSAVLGLFFVWMPAFVYHRWRKKDVKDYMLTPENLKKMKAFKNKSES